VFEALGDARVQGLRQDGELLPHLQHALLLLSSP
jgi:Fe-S protein assembly co-chaperone HscB